LFAILALLCSLPVRADEQAAPPRLSFAVEIKTGPQWDTAKGAADQAHFRQHSANLKTLRDQGHLLVGARYADKGLLIVQAASLDDVHAMMKQDPSIQSQVFAYQVHEMNVFYGGAVPAKAPAKK
ncbi:MAG TPA: YciI family protein, partial [Burkholderiaceae bacterium]